MSLGDERASVSRPVVLPEKFNGTNNFNEWISHFEGIAAINKWTDEDKKLWLGIRLTDKAHVAFTRLPTSAHQSYEALKLALTERFEPTSKQEVFKAEFESRRKSKTESWGDFGDELLRLVDKAYPALQYQAKEQFALSRYLDQLEPAEVAFGVKQRRPKTINEAVSSTIELESYLMKPAHRNSSSVSHAPTDEQLMTESVRAVQQDLVGVMQKLVERVEKLELGASQQRRYQPPKRERGSPRNPSAPIICRRCNQPGHYARGCATNVNQQGSRDGGTLTYGGLYIPDVQGVNNVQSYFVLGKVYSSPVSFLVDTGAGVSLIRGDVWDKAVPSNYKQKLQTANSLVGVDGSPLQLRGTASVKISVGNLTICHTFVIADKITAEAILGMDFLEENKCVLDLHKGELSMKDQTRIQLQPHSVGQLLARNNCKVSLVETCEIPATSEVEVMARLSTEENDHTWVVETTDSAVPIRVARALVKPKGGFIPIRVINTNLTPVKVYKGSTVAHADTLDESTISVVSEDATPGASQAASLNIPESLIPDNLKDEEKEHLVALLELYSDIIANDEHDLGCTGVLQHTIDTGSATPIRQQVRRLSLPAKEEVKKLLQNMLEKHVITPSTSPWASPIVLVQKKDGSTRFCVDYRKVNSVTRKDAYPIPKIDETLDTLAGAKLFSTLDLRSGYWQVEVKPEHREKTAFCTPEGLFEFNVMPFGLCNAPATFQRLMDSVLAGLHWKTCLVYIDDIIVIGRSFEEHLCNLQAVFERLRKVGLKLQPRKCQLLQQRVTYLGHVVSAQGIAPDVEKTRRVNQWPTPQSPKEVQQFLGLANYYRRFIKDFASLAKPLHRLTEKGTQFKWTKESETAFNTLKQKLTSAPILALPNWSKPFTIDTDASETGIGAVLSQMQDDGKECVIAYASRLLTKQERNYCVTRKELLAVVTFLQHFRQYLIGSMFTIRTDHSALTWLQNFKHPEGQLARWLEKLQEFQFTIVHRPGRAHGNADALSRQPVRHCNKECLDAHDCTINAVTMAAFGYTTAELHQAQTDDRNISKLLQAKQCNRQPLMNESKGESLEYRRLLQQWDQLLVQDGILWRLYAQPREGLSWKQLVVPKTFRTDILKHLHEGVTGGHLGQEKTLNKLKERFYWPGHYSDVRDWCQTCVACSKRKSPPTSYKAPMQTITAAYPTQVMAVDLLGPLPESENGNSYVMVVGDYYTRWMEALAIPNQEASTVAEKLVDEVFLRFSPPEQLHSDQGRQFESTLLAEICKILQIKKTKTTPYHPQCDGLVERFNRTLLSMLAVSTDKHPFDWEQQLRKVCMAYNTSIQSSTGFTPFYLMFGRQARLPVDIIYGTSTPENEGQGVGQYAMSLKKKMAEAFELVRESTSKHHMHQKMLYDEKIHGKPYKAGDWVWLHSPVVPSGSSRKLHCPWKGPYSIVKRISDATYRIQHLQKRKDRQVVHFNRLKPCSKNIRLEGSEPLVTLPTPPVHSNVQSEDHNDIELVDYPDDCEYSSPETNTTQQTSEPQVRRNPSRERHPPQRYSDYVQH